MGPTGATMSSSSSPAFSATYRPRLLRGKKKKIDRVHFLVRATGMILLPLGLTYIIRENLSLAKCLSPPAVLPFSWYVSSVRTLSLSAYACIRYARTYLVLLVSVAKRPHVSHREWKKTPMH